MKRLTKLVCALTAMAVTSMLWAVEVTPEQAQTAVKNWVLKSPKKLTAKFGTADAAKTLTSKNDNGLALYHVVNFTDGGFVVTSGDTKLPPIIAFSESGELNISEEGNPLRVLLERDMSCRVDALSNKTTSPKVLRYSATSGNAASFEDEWSELLHANHADKTYKSDGAVSSLSDVRVAPMVQSKWGQSYWNGYATFNYYTPGHYVCGCVATAFAQIMRYWEKPSTSVVAGNYQCWSNDVSRVFSMKGGTYSWLNMPLTSSDCTNTIQRQAIGKLLYDVGVASQMSWSTNGSGTVLFTASKALNSRFGYASSQSFIDIAGYGLWQDFTTQQTEFRDAILASLDAEMPVAIGVGGSYGGHAIVVDGYGYSGSTIYCHLNCGWSGSEDAWYNLLGDYITSYSFAYLDSLGYNIHPTASGDVISGRVLDSSGNAVSDVIVTLVTPSGGTMTTTTNYKGIYYFRVNSSGTYTVTAYGETETATRSITLTMSTPCTATLTLTGNIGDASGNPVRDASGNYIGPDGLGGVLGNSWGNDLTLGVTTPSGPPAATRISISTYGSSAKTSYIYVTWTNVAAATSYNVYRSTTNSRPASPIKTGVTNTYYYDYASTSGLTPGVKYYYWVESVNSAGSSFSNSDWGNILVSVSLGKSTLGFAAAGGTSNITVTANTSWSATKSDSWLSLSTSGTSGNGTIAVTATANPNTTSRTGRVIVTAGAGSSYPKTVTNVVTQAGGTSSTSPIWTINASGTLTAVDLNGCTDIAIPEGVKSMSSYVFREMPVTSVRLPATLESVGVYAFYECRSLTNVTFSTGLRKIDSWAFCFCTSLTHVFEIPEGVIDVAFGALMGTGVSTLVFPSTLQKLGSQQTVFGTPLTAVYFKGNAPILEEDGSVNYPDSTSPYCDASSSLVTYVRVGSTGWKDSSSALPESWPTYAARPIQNYSGEPPHGTSGVVPTANPTTYIVTYQPGSYASGSTYTATKTNDVALVLRGGTYSRTGYTQTGWSTSASGTSKSYNLSASYTANAAITLYPYWTANTYSVTYALNGGTHGTTHPSSATYGTVFYVSAPTKTGYTFAGWTVTSGLNTSTAKYGTSSSSLTTSITSTTQMCLNGASGDVWFLNLTSTANGSVTLTANWTSSSDFTYNIVSGSAVITKYTGSSSTVVIPSTIDGYTVTALADYAFHQSTITSITLPDSLTKIGWFSLAHCTRLTTIHLPANVAQFTSRQYAPFGGNTSQATFTVDPENTHFTAVDGVLFTKDMKELVSFPAGKNVESYEVPSSVTNIWGSAFRSCRYLLRVTIPEGVSSLMYCAFSNSNLTSVSLPESLRTIDYYVFQYCSSLKSLTIPAGVTTIGYNALNTSSLTNLVLLGRSGGGSYASEKWGASIANANIWVMPDDYDYWTAKLGEGLSVIAVGSSTEFPYKLVNGNAIITNYTGTSGDVIFPAVIDGHPVTEIAATAFYYGTYPFVNVTISEGIQKIGHAAFGYSSALETFSIPSTLTVLGDSNGSEFLACPKLRRIDVAAGNPNYKSVDGVLYNKAGTTLIYCPASKNPGGDFAVPASVTSMEEYAFDCSRFRTVVLPDGLRKIEDNLFWSASGLVSMEIPETVDSIGRWAFCYCSSLADIRLPSSLTTIGQYAFTSTKVGALDVPAGVTSIGQDAFKTTSLTNLILRGRVATTYASNKWGSNIDNSKVWVMRADVDYWQTVFGTGFNILDPETPVSQTYEVVYNPGAYASGVQETATKTNGVALTLKGAIFTRTGYSQTGWSTSSTGTSKTYNLGASYTTDEAITLYPYWTANTYSVTYALNGGTHGTTHPTSATYDTAFYVSAPTKSGYTFTGWTVTSGLNTSTAKWGTTSSPSTSLTSTTTKCVNGATGNVYFKNLRPTSGSVTLTANWAGSPIWTIDANGTLTAVDLNGCTDVVIPNTVRNIGDYAFAECDGLLSVTIPDSVTNIGYRAFCDCQFLEEVRIPSSVSSIEGGVFAGCGNLTTIVVDANNNSYKFENGLLLSLDGRSLVRAVADMTHIVIPNGVVSIMESAFDGCSALVGVTIPSSVTSVGAYAFWDCSALSDLTLPDSVTDIGMAAFCGCRGLADEDGFVIIRNILCWYCGTDSVVTVPGNIASIGSQAFYDCGALTNVTIGSGVTDIGLGAFYACENLVSVTFLGNAPSIGEMCFDYVNSSCVVYVGRNSTGWGVSIPGTWNGLQIEYAEGGGELNGPIWTIDANGNLTSVDLNGCTDIVIPDTVRNIGTNVFRSTAITSVTIPNSVTNIGAYAFYSCRGLTSVTIPNSVTGIGSYAFHNCSGLTGVTIPNSVTGIGAYAFNYCNGLTSVRITDIAAWCRISFGNGTANPLYYAHNLYLDDSLLTNLVIPNSVTSIGTNTFYGCSGLTSVTIPNSVTSIGSSAFYNCSGLTGVYITDIAAWCRISFGNGSANPLYYAHNLYLDGSVLTNLVIPNSVTSIRSYAFYNGRGLTSVTMPNSVTNIGSYAFYYCSGLTSVTIPNSVPGIGNYAFGFCSGLTSMTIPNSVTSIGSYAFCYCRGLTSVTIPNSVTGIGSGAFSGCSGLTSVTIPDSVTGIWSGAFAYCSALTNVTILGTLNNYSISSLYSSTPTDLTTYVTANWTGPTDTWLDHPVAFLTHSVTFNANGGTGTMPNQDVVWYATSNLTANAFSRTGYSFSGWATNPTGAVVYVNGASITPSADMTLYAKWIPAASLSTALDNASLTFTTGGNADWTVDADSSAIGGISARSGAIAPEESTWVQTTVSGTGTLSFSWKADCEKDPRNRYTYDFGAFAIDGNVTNRIDGTTAWQMVTIEITDGGTHVLRWTYSKDDYDEDDYVGEDCIWVDHVVWTPRGDAGLAAWLAERGLTAESRAANGRTAAECYVLGLDPADETNDFRIVSIELVDGKPKVEWEPKVNRWTGAEIQAVLMGATRLDGPWAVVPEGGNPAFRFFKVVVALEGAVDTHAKVQLWAGGPYWAETNIGAEVPWESGYYFWWGDIVGYTYENNAWVASDGSSLNFSFSSGNVPTYNKTTVTLQSEGWITADGVLAPEHDAAQVQWGGGWRMPTYQELSDLNSKCDWTWTTKNGVNGYEVCGQGDYAASSIFLPAAGFGYGTSLANAGSYGYYWSSVPGSGNFNSWSLSFGSGYHGTSYFSRYFGYPVRPVQGFTE